jgi:hypothetical protein
VVEKIEDTTNEISVKLYSDVIEYLYDAGFNNNYRIENFNNRRYYIEVFFDCDEAINFIIDDIKKTNFDDILEVKKYCYDYDHYSAIFAYK